MTDYALPTDDDLASITDATNTVATTLADLAELLVHQLALVSSARHPDLFSQYVQMLSQVANYRAQVSQLSYQQSSLASLVAQARVDETPPPDSDPHDGGTDDGSDDGSDPHGDDGTEGP